MVRRTVLAIGMLCGATGAAALAFRSGISRGPAHSEVPIAASPEQIPRAEFCAFPPRGGSEAATAVPANTLLGTSAGLPPLARGGQSRIPDALPPALCQGDTAGPPSAPLPRTP